MKEIPLAGKMGAGLSAMVDDEDYDDLNQYHWTATFRTLKNRRRVLTAVSRHTNPADIENGITVSNIRIHRYLMGFPDKFVDHRDGNPLNNQKYNLRLVTNHQNIMNAKPNKHRRTGIKYKGVYQNTGYPNRFSAKIGYKCKRISLGTYGSQEEAAMAYNDAAIKYFGVYAHLNVIEGA